MMDATGQKKEIEVPKKEKIGRFIFRLLGRLLRFTFKFLAITLLLVVLLLGGVKFLLAVGMLRPWLDQTVSGIANFPIRVKVCELGLFGNSSVRKVDVFETDLSKPEPWLKINSFETDISLWRLVRGLVVPETVFVDNASVTLHFDINGDLQTKLPKSENQNPPKMPRFFLKNSDFCLKQEGRPPLIIKGIEAEIWRNENNDMIIHANFQDDTWKSWNLTSRVEPGVGDSELKLTTNEVYLSRELLESLPFVPKVTWNHIKLNGTSSVEMDLFFDGKKDTIDYKIGMAPKNTSVKIAIINLEANDASGKIQIDNGLIQIREVQGRSAHGTIELRTADLDFRSPNYQMDYDLKVKNMKVQELPEAWGLKDKNGKSFIQGILDGYAKLKFLYDPLKGLQTSGNGMGMIGEAKIFGFPAKSIPLELQSDGAKFKITPVSGIPSLLPPEIKKEKKPVEVPSNNLLFFQTELHLENIPVRDLLTHTSTKLPDDISGTMSLDVQIGIPFDKILDRDSYLGQAKVQFKNARLAGVHIPDLHAFLDMQDGAIVLRELKAKVSKKTLNQNEKILVGEINAAARMDLKEDGIIHCKAQAFSIPLELFSLWLPEEISKVKGFLSFGLDLKSSVTKVFDISNWDAGALFRFDNFAYEALAFPAIDGKLNLSLGRLDLFDFKTASQLGKFAGNATLHLGQSFPFQVNLSAKALDFSNAYLILGREKLFFDPEGLGEVDALATGNLKPLAWLASGDLRLEKFKAGRLILEKNHTKWLINANKLVFNDAGGTTMGGSWNADAEIPLSSANAGNVKFTIKDIDAGLLVRTASNRELPVKGKIGGVIQTNFSPQDKMGEREVLFNADLNTAGYEILGIPLRQTKAQVYWKRGGINGLVETDFADGRGKVDFNIGSGSSAKMKGVFSIKGAKANQILLAFDAGEQLKKLDAICNLDLPYELDIDSFLVAANGKLVLNRLSHSNVILSDQLQANVFIEKNEVNIKDISGNVAEGQLRGLVFLNFENMEKSFYRGTLNQAEIAKLFAPWFASWKPSGKMDLRFSGKLGHELTATGETFVSGLKFYGADFGDWRSPFDYSAAQARGAGTFIMRDIAGSFAGGKVYGSNEYRWGVGNSLNGNFRFQSLEMKAVQAQFSDSRTQGSGILQGKLAFAGRDIKSMDNITANLEGTLTQSRAQGIPIVRDLIPFLPVAATGTFFEKGELKARMDRGIIRVQRLAISNSLMMVLIEGNITTQGKLDLEATARTGSFSVLPEAMRNLGLKIPAVGAVPLDLLSQATGAIAAGILHFKITGTYRSPIVKSVALTLLTEEAIRFFFGRLSSSGQ